MTVKDEIGRRTRSARRLSAVALACALAMGALAAAALAGQYHVYSCRTPAGEGIGADGWSGSSAGKGAVDKDTCGEPGGALIAGLVANEPRLANEAVATWTFAPPSADTLTKATLWRAEDAEGGVPNQNASYEVGLAGPTETKYFNTCFAALDCVGLGNQAVPFSGMNLVEVLPPNLGGRLYAEALCSGGVASAHCPEGAADNNGYAAAIYIYAADLVLEQSAGPSASDAGGELASAPVLSGTSDVTFHASDPGAGVYQAVVSLDGQVVQRTTVDEEGGRCRNVGQTADGLPAFLYVQPCPSSVAADVGLDTSRFANGAHRLAVAVTDAAGNSAIVLERNVVFANALAPGAPAAGPNGTNASPNALLAVRWKSTKRARLIAGYGQGETILGSLTTSTGAPIAGAAVTVLATPDFAGARTASAVALTTNAAGQFTLRLPRGLSSRTLRFEYSDELGAPPVVTRALSLTVPASVGLTVTPHTASASGSIYFSGRLRGGPIPAGGKLLVLEARSPGGAWLEFDVIRSDSRGAFHAGYRFKFPGPASYQFRVLCEAEADYPFATGASNVVGVFERG
jgi:hypothetical protein